MKQIQTEVETKNKRQQLQRFAVYGMKIQKSGKKKGEK